MAARRKKACGVARKAKARKTTYKRRKSVASRKKSIIKKLVDLLK